MSDSTTTAAATARFQRASALEEKRRKLEDLKKKRDVRGSDTARIQATQQTTNLDDYIDDLLKDNTSNTTANSNATCTTGKDVTSAAVTSTASANRTADGTTDQTVPLPHDSGSHTGSYDPYATTSTSSTSPSVNKNDEVTLQTRRIETFSISTQTEEEELEDDDVPPRSSTTVEPDDDNQDEKQAKEVHNDDVLRQKMDLNDTISTIDQTVNYKVKVQEEPKVLSRHEIVKEVTKQPFTAFLHAASKKVERRLGSTNASSSSSALLPQQQRQNTDIYMIDYVTDQDPNRTSDNVHNVDEASSSSLSWMVQSKVLYECPKWTRQRDVTSLDWSPIHRELLLSTYHGMNTSMTNSTISSNTATTTTTALANTNSSNIVRGSNANSDKAVSTSSSLTPRSGDLLSEGLVLIWSPLLPNRPEHVLTCGTPVTCGKFHPTDPTLIVGGGASGQLMIWDLRCGQRLPVQKSAIPTVSSTLQPSTNAANSKGHPHAHAIGAIEILDGGVRTFY
jgi:hypothetical protein